MKPLDIAIAGCGPVGLTAALLLDRAGHRVVLFERFDRPQPVGSGLLIQPTGRAVLRVLELEQELLDLGQRVHRLIGHAADSGRRVLDVRYAALGGRGDFGLGVHRAALFEVLFRAVERAGIVIETAREVTGTTLAEGGRRLDFASGTASPRFDLVVDALGARSPLADEPVRPLRYGALWATLPWPVDGGFDAHALQQRYRAARIMVGVLPAGHLPGESGSCAAFFWSIRDDQVAAWRAAGLEAWKDAARALWPETAPLLDAIGDADQLTHARYAHRTLRKPVGERLIHLGDAWHSTSPQLGQGANMALLDAYALSVALERSADLQQALADAVSLRRGHVLRYQAMSRWLTPVYQSDGRFVPFLRDRLVGPLASFRPVQMVQAAMVAGLIGRPLHRLGLA